MTFEDIQAFVLVHQLKSITKTARELNISQSELSKRLHKMQDELNISLIDTTNKRHLKITEAGTIFYKSALTILNQYETTLLTLSQHRASVGSTLRVGVVPVSGQYKIAKIISTFNNEHPHIKVRLIEDTGQKIVEMLKSNEIDAAILRDTQTKYFSKIKYGIKNLISDELMVVMAADHALNTNRDISISDLQNQKILTLPAGSGVYEPVENLFKKHHFTPDIYFQSSHIETLLGMLNHSSNVTFLFNKSVKPFISPQIAVKSITPPFFSSLQFVYPQLKGNQLTLSVLHRIFKELSQQQLPK